MARNVFWFVERYGDCDGFEPKSYEEFLPTAAQPGTPEKVEVLARRVELGLPLWHEQDRSDHIEPNVASSFGFRKKKISETPAKSA